MAGNFRLVASMLSGEWQRAMEADRRYVAAVATKTMRETGDDVKAKGRAAIAGGGFSRRWQNALRVTVYPQRGTSIEPAVYIRHKIPYAAVFENGARISGKPLLWLPLSNVQQRVGGRAMTPRLFTQVVGPLFTLRMPMARRPLLGAYLLRSADTTRITVAKLRNGQRAPAARRKAVPVFVGVPAVEVHKRFDLKSVFRAASDAVPRRYEANAGLAG